jgi:hypothetical protein
MNVPLDKIGEIFDGGVSLTGIRALVYSGLLAYDQEEGNEIDYNIYKVGAWLDDMKANELEKIVNAMLESKILGTELNMGIDRNPKSEGKQSPTP